MGPDGAIYIADWYNPIIQHGEVDFRDPRRDHTRGRIWRVTAKGRPLVSRPDWSARRSTALLDPLKAPEDWTRQQAKRVLKERGAAEVVPALRELGRAGLTRATRSPSTIAWRPSGPTRPSTSPSRVARGAARFAGRPRPGGGRRASSRSGRRGSPIRGRSWPSGSRTRTRASGSRPCAAWPQFPACSGRAGAGGARPAVDRFLEYGLWLTARQLAPFWLPEVQAGRFDFGGRPGAPGLRARGPSTRPTSVKPLLALLQERQGPRRIRTRASRR